MANNGKLRFDRLEVDITGRNVCVDGEKAELTPKEYELLFYLVKNKNIALSREKLLSDVWGYDFTGDDRTVNTHIKMLRNNIGKYRDRHHFDCPVAFADRLVNDILDLSRIQSGTEEMDLKSFDISKTVQNIMKRYHILVEREGYVFECSCAENVTVTGDEKRIEQVIYNLINNAVNYTGNDKRVAIRLLASGDKVRFEVTDTGKGIPKEKLETIWERYYQAEESHKRAVVGAGLGLSIVKSILAAHQADFGVNSTRGEGSTFWFELKK